MKDLNKVWAEAIELLNLTKVSKKESLEIAVNDIEWLNKDLNVLASDYDLYKDSSDEVKLWKQQLGHMLMMVVSILNDLGIDPCDALSSSIAEGRSVLNENIN